MSNSKESFILPEYQSPDFAELGLDKGRLANFEPAPADGVAPEHFHATSIFPEYINLESGWQLLLESRMDCVVVYADEELAVTEKRRLKKGQAVLVGRKEDGSEGIYVHTGAFPDLAATGTGEKFAFRSNVSRETAFSVDYDFLYELLCHERDHGSVVWVLGPAVVFDHDARTSFCELIKLGFVDAVLAGNALATHDIEAAFFSTALGQHIYDKVSLEEGHYKHLDTINRIRGLGGIKEAVASGDLKEGVMYQLTVHDVDYVLAGSIRDDGPLPEVAPDVYQAQDRMRAVVKKATTVITMATQLHSIATGNMTPSYTKDKAGKLRPVYFFAVDMTEFATSKLTDRESLAARPILTNVQDFVVHLERGLSRKLNKT